MPPAPRNLDTSPDERRRKPNRRDEEPPGVEGRRQFEQLFAAFSQGPHDPVADKLQPEHIGMIALDGKRTAVTAAGWAMIRSVVLAALAVVAVVTISWLFLWYSKPEYLTPLATLIVGAAGGYGVGRYRGSKRRRIR